MCVDYTQHGSEASKILSENADFLQKQTKASSYISASPQQSRHGQVTMEVHSHKIKD